MVMFAPFAITANAAGALGATPIRTPRPFRLPRCLPYFATICTICGVTVRGNHRCTRGKYHGERADTQVCPYHVGMTTDHRGDRIGGVGDVAGGVAGNAPTNVT